MVKKYYRISYSSDSDIIGTAREGQVVHATYPLPIAHPLLSRNLKLEKASHPDEIVTPKPIVEKNAKLADLLAGPVNSGMGNQLMISDKLKRILEPYQRGNVQFFPLSVIYNKVEINTYWLIHAHSFDTERISFSNSVYQLENFDDYKKNRPIVISSFHEFMKIQAETKWPYGFTNQKLVLKKGEEEMLILRWVKVGVAYYVSEKVKYEIEEAGCSDIQFDPVETV